MAGFSSSDSSSESEPVDATPSDVAAFRQGIQAFVNDFLASPGQASGTGSAQEILNAANILTPEMTDEAKAALAGLRDASGPSDAETAAGAFLTNILEGGGLDLSDPRVSEAVDLATAGVVQEADRDNETLRGLFAQSGQELSSSSPFAEAFAELSGEKGENIARARSGILFPLLETEAEREISAASLSSQLADSLAARQSALVEAELIPTDIAFRGIDAAIADADSRRAVLASIFGSSLAASAPSVGTRSESESESMGISIL